MLPDTPSRLLYRIAHQAAWRQASDPWLGSDLDHRDGFVHLSRATQVAGTLAAHFQSHDDLVLLTIDVAQLPAGKLIWEVSRNGERFPHLYAPLPHAAVVQISPLRFVDGRFALPDHVSKASA